MIPSFAFRHNLDFCSPRLLKAGETHQNQKPMLKTLPTHTLARLAAAAMFLALVAPSFAAETILIPLTNAWRYNQTVSYNGSNWTAPTFNDSALPLGRGVLAYETNSAFVHARTNTVLTIGRTTYYFRTPFVFTGTTAGLVLTFSNLVDDGAVFYLNGVEVQRLFMTNNTTPVVYATLAANHEATGFDVFTLAGPIVETNLVQGTNILAVEVHQTTAGSSDIVFGCALSAVATELTPLPLRLPVVPPVYGYAVVDAFPGFSFGAPVGMASPPGETNRLFVLNKLGQVYVITNLASPTLTTFLDLSGRVYTGSESGVIGLAFHPDYANPTNRFFYLFYSLNTNSPQGSGLHQRVSRFQTSAANPNQALASTEVVLLNQKDPAGNHNGGDLHFGPDGYLYISLGDGGVQYDGDRNSQTITSNFFSAICRIDVDTPPRPGSLLPNPHPANTNGGTFNYRIPADNPFIGATNFDGVTINSNRVRTEFYAVGFRNPWRFSFDPVTGFLYCGDVGQDTWEEVDIITKGGNYGWAYMEGNHTGYRTSNTVVGPLIPPIQEYRHGSATNQGNSVTGGIVYRGTRLSQLTGWYVFADYASGNIWALNYDGTNTIPFQRIAGQTGIAAFGRDPSSGDVLMANVNNGTLHRLVYNTNSATGAPIPATLADTGAFANLAALTNQTQPLIPNAGLLPYDINVHFWSDNARKSRWFLSATNLKIGFSPEGNWSFPSGMAWIKHFDLELTNGAAASARRLETRFLVKNSNGTYGVTYRWNSLTNATLVAEDGQDEAILINDGGNLRTQAWRFPSRTECATCHTPVGGFALGFSTVQMNRDLAYPGGVSNQISFLSAAGMFSNAVTEVNSLRALAAATNDSASLEWRVRSYLSANCSQCHQAGGASLGFWNANITNSTSAANLILSALNNQLGTTNAKVITPGSITNSMLLTRISRRGTLQMPPVGSSVLDTQAVALISAWITNDLAGGWTNAVDPAYLDIGVTNGAVAVIFTQPPNRAFRLETATNLGFPVQWQFLDVPGNRPVYPATTNAISIADAPTNAPQKFYRVRMSAP